MSSVVLDASAVLAVIHHERGFENVVPHLRGGVISAVNYSEVLKKAIDSGSAPGQTRIMINSFALEIIPFDERHAITAASFWPASRSHGLSFADRSCLALALGRSASVLTGDRRWKELDLGVKVELFR